MIQNSRESVKAFERNCKKTPKMAAILARDGNIKSPYTYKDFLYVTPPNMLIPNFTTIVQGRNRQVPIPNALFGQ